MSKTARAERTVKQTEDTKQAGPTVFALVGGQHVDLSKVALPSTEDVREWARAAWVLDGPVIEIDMAAARAILLADIRAARAQKWHDVDGRYMRAVQRGLDPAPVVRIAETLRDITVDPRIAQAKTPEDLKAAADAVLTAMAGL